MKEFVKNCTTELAMICAHGCITSSTFAVPKQKIIVLFGKPGESLYNSFIQSLLVEKQSCLDVLAGKSCASSNGVPLYTVIAKEGDVITDVMLKFQDDNFETGIFAFPLSETHNQQLKGIPSVPHGTIIRLSDLFKHFLSKRPGAYFIAACRDSCYQQALLVQKAQALDEVIRSKSPGVYRPHTMFHKNFTWFSTLVKYQRDVGLPTEIFHLLIPINKMVLKDRTDYNRASLDFNNAVLKSRPFIDNLTVYELAELFYLRDCLIKCWITLQLIDSVYRKYGITWSYGFIASSQLMSHVSNSDKLSTIVDNFNKNANRGRVMSIQRRNRSTVNVNNSVEVIAAQKAAEAAAELERDAIYHAAHEFLNQVNSHQPWKLLFRADGSLDNQEKLLQVVKVIKKKPWWKLW